MSEKTEKRMPWFRILLGIIYAALIVTIGIYENNAQDILHFSKDMENMKRYQTAAMGYQVVIEKFDLSYAVIKAKENSKARGIKNEINFSKKSVKTFTKKCFRWFNPYMHYGLPLVATLVCGLVLLGIFIARLCFAKFAFFTLILACVSFALFAAQLVEYGIIKDIHTNKITHATIINNIQLLYISSYFLIIISMVKSIIPRKWR